MAFLNGYTLLCLTIVVINHFYIVICAQPRTMNDDLHCATSGALHLLSLFKNNE